MAFYQYWNKYIFDCYKKISKYEDIECIKKRDKLFKKSIEAVEKKQLYNNEIMGLLEEIRLFDYLNEIKLNASFIKETKKGSPDLITDIGYIECVAISKGTGENKKIYEKTMSGKFSRYKAGEPRFTTSICEKKQKFEKYLASKVIDNKLPRIIALNTSIFSDEVHSDEAVDIVYKLLYGLDTQVMLFQKNSKIENNINKDAAYYNYGITVQKDDKNNFETGYFCNDGFKEITAIILNNNATCEDITQEYCKIFLNPYANIPIDEKKLSKFTYLKRSFVDNSVYNWFNKENTNESNT